MPWGCAAILQYIFGLCKSVRPSEARHPHHGNAASMPHKMCKRTRFTKDAGEFSPSEFTCSFNRGLQHKPKGLLCLSARLL
eukprot:4101120-Amphidinium_carterae.1